MRSDEDDEWRDRKMLESAPDAEEETYPFTQDEVQNVPSRMNWDQVDVFDYVMWGKLLEAERVDALLVNGQELYSILIAKGMYVEMRTEHTISVTCIGIHCVGWN